MAAKAATQEAQAAALLERQVQAALRLRRVMGARESLLDFATLSMPDPADPDDIAKTRFEVAPHHQLIAQALRRVRDGSIQRLAISMPPRHGKQIAHSTPVLTFDGWKTHGELRVGDQVFHPSGRPIKVLAVSQDTMATYQVETSTGEVIKAHANHEWTVYSRGARAWITLETSELARRALSSGPIGRRGGRYSYQLPNVEAIEFPEAELLMAPYVLGAWLGDGTSTKPWITHAANDEAVPQAIEDLGYARSKTYVHRTTGVVSSVFAGPRPNVPSQFWKDLRALGVVGNKHIPEPYLRGSIQQRLELLAGLIDTDGYVGKTGRVVFTTAMPVLADDVFRLVTELGMRPKMQEVAPQVSSSGIEGRQVVLRVVFQPTMPIPCRLDRKRVHRWPQQRRVAITAVRPCDPEPGRCIQVDSPDGLYLVGRNLTPTHNSELATRLFPAWCIGHNPYWQIILAGATHEFATEEFGRKIRGVMETPMYQQVFPGAGLRGGSKKVDALTTKEGGNIKSIGKGGQIVGRGADLVVIDDPYSGREEAFSPAERRKVRQWFTADVVSRMMPGGRIVVIHQRWHEDDLIGWLTDPNHPEHNPRISGRWTHLYLPAIITDPELAALLRVDLEVPADPEHRFMFGDRPMRPLWPERYGLDFFSEIKAQDSQTFEALYMGNPTPDDGEFFRREHIVPYMYSPAELPKNLRYYVASDHATSEDQRNDPTCIIVAGVDEVGTIWIVEAWWKRKETDDVVDAMLDIMKRYRILTWWAERGHISKSIGPFLRKRMVEEHAFTNVVEVTPAKDKMTRAQAIQGRMSMGRVRFPQHAPWMQAALDEMLKFPMARHDDFVDAMAHLGGGLAQQAAAKTITPKREAPRVGTLAWVKESAKREARRLAMRRGSL